MDFSGGAARRGEKNAAATCIRANRRKGRRRDTAKPMFSMKGNMKYESAPGGAAARNEKGSISGRFCATGVNTLVKFIAVPG